MTEITYRWLQPKEPFSMTSHGVEVDAVGNAIRLFDENGCFRVFNQYDLRPILEVAAQGVKFLIDLTERATSFERGW